MLIKTTLKYYHMPPRLAKIKNRSYQVLVRMWKNWNSQTLLIGSDWKVKFYNTLENNLSVY